MSGREVMNIIIMSKERTLWKWKKGDIIRNILSGRPLLVLHVYSLGPNSSATLTVSLEERCDPTPVTILQQRDYDHWVRDYELEVKNNGEMVKYRQW